MATRLYPATGSTATTPSVGASWEVTASGFGRIPLSTSTGDYLAAGFAATPSGSGSANQDTVNMQFIYGPLLTQTISGTVKGQFAAREANAGTDARIQGLIRVIAADGTVRGTLLAHDGSALSNEFVVDAANLRNIKFPLNGSQSLTAVTAQTGDYLVIEVGFRNHGTNTSAVRVNVSAGDGSNGDLPENETQTPPTNYRCWIEFSQDIIKYRGRAAVVHDVGQGSL